MNEKKTKLSDEELDAITQEELPENAKDLYRIDRGRLPIPKNHVDYNAIRGEVKINGTKISRVLSCELHRHGDDPTTVILKFHTNDADVRIG